MAVKYFHREVQKIVGQNCLNFIFIKFFCDETITENFIKVFDASATESCWSGVLSGSGSL